MKIFRLAMAQLNSTLGDLHGNVRSICHWIDQAKAQGADLVAFPELAITGYPPEDLLLHPRFVSDNLKALEEVQAKARGITVVVGFVDRQEGLYNAAAVLHQQAVAGIYHKICLPNYGVFDEKRYFRAGTQCPVFVIRGTRIAVSICEDLWDSDGPTVAQTLVGGAEVILNISASPYHMGRGRDREKLVAARARDNAVILAYLNMVGGQDELIYDGQSLICDPQGTPLFRAGQFREELILTDLRVDGVLRERDRLHARSRKKLSRLKANAESSWPVPLIPVSRSVSRGRGTSGTASPRLHRSRKVQPLLASMEEVYEALLLGTRDYVRKNHFSRVVIGLSGGIDSSLTATIAADALGPENVRGVFMPSEYTSSLSRKDVHALGQNLRIKLLTLPIQDIFQSYLKGLSREFNRCNPDVTEENLQARIRGNLLMALSNKFGWLVLTTGNKSEMSVGYATLYGDMAGGFSLIKDVPKLLVYRLARYANRRHGTRVIPRSILQRPPTAELRPGQTDQDTLPPYSDLDPILRAYVEKHQTLGEIQARGFDRSVVAQVITRVDQSEYKRRQAPLGIRITPRALGKDRRMPVTNRYRVSS